jgi:hypothetical protein
MKDLYARIRADVARMYRSWTIWVNGVFGAILLALPFAQDNLPQLQNYVPPIYYKYAMGVIVVANILLRFKTTKALSEK